MEFSPEIQAALWGIGAVALRQLLEVIGKAIPDSATGLMGIARKLAKMASGYITDDKS